MSKFHFQEPNLVTRHYFLHIPHPGQGKIMVEQIQRKRNSTRRPEMTDPAENRMGEAVASRTLGGRALIMGENEGFLCSSAYFSAPPSLGFVGLLKGIVWQ